MSAGRSSGFSAGFLAGLLAIVLGGCAPSARAPVVQEPARAPSAGAQLPSTGAQAPSARPQAPAGSAAAETPRADRTGSPGAGTAATLAADPSPACLESIEAVAERASGNRVLLGPAAFASSGELVLTRGIVRGPDGRVLDGRMPVPAPVVLRLSLVEGQCVVIQVPAGASSLPAATPAEPVAPLVVTEPVRLPECRCQSAAH